MKDYAQYSYASRIPSPANRKVVVGTPMSSPKRNGNSSFGTTAQRSNNRQALNNKFSNTNASTGTVSTAASSTAVTPTQSSSPVTPVSGASRTTNTNYSSGINYPYQRARNGNGRHTNMNNAGGRPGSQRSPSPSPGAAAAASPSTQSDTANGNSNNRGNVRGNYFFNKHRNSAGNNGNSNGNGNSNQNRAQNQRSMTPKGNAAPNTNNPSNNASNNASRVVVLPTTRSRANSANRNTNTHTNTTTNETTATPPSATMNARARTTRTPSPRPSTNTRSPAASTRTSTPTTPSTPVGLSASDALAMRRDGSEATISRLRSALDDAQAKDSTAKAALAKSDAVILELRSSVRNMKRQLEQAQDERHDFKQKHDQINKQLAQQRATSHQSNSTKVQELENTVQSLRSQLQIEESQANNAKVGELQVQLDRAHAQILTADMIRKELEDTLEAEQYTWELRVQDQDRQIAQLHQECNQLKEDLEACRAQWKEAEVGWNDQLADLQAQLRQARTRLATTAASKTQSNNDRDELLQKISSLEHERSELQNCLDEALKELEAVDAELQHDGKKPTEAVQTMQGLLQWITDEHSNVQRHDAMPTDPKELAQELQTTIETVLAPDQLEMYKRELKSREESSGELRESLKEAVALLKPLQDAVGKAEVDKKAMEEEIKALQQKQHGESLERRRRDLQLAEMDEQIQSLQQQLDESQQLAQAREKLLAASPSANNRSVSASEPISKLQRAREELRRKRETETNLQQMLRDAQNRFSSMHQQNEDMASKNRELQGQLNESSMSEQYENRLEEREREIDSLRTMLQSRSDGAQVEELESQLRLSRTQLTKKEQSEKVLNKSLKEALGLLKPLQMHLEEAEREKLMISKELRTMRKKFRRMQSNGHDHGDDHSRSTFGGTHDPTFEFQRMKDEMEETIRQLELENSQLHDKIEDLATRSSEVGASRDSGDKLRQKFIELNSRYEVTQNKLQDANTENHSLIHALKKREQQDQARNAEYHRMKAALQKTEAELHNAKAIARSALVKVEELTMDNIEKTSALDEGMNSATVPPIK